MKNIKVVDTNVILRYLLEDDEELFNKARRIFDKALNRESEILIKEVVIAEVVYVLEKVYKINRKIIAETLKELLILKGIKVENKDFVIKALEIYKNKKLDFVDCILCSISDHYVIETFDKKLNRCISS